MMAMPPNSAETDAQTSGEAIDPKATAPKPSTAEAAEAAGLGRVTRCVCFDVSFDKLLEMHNASGAGLMEFYQAYGCGSRCSICMPYILLLLKRKTPVLGVHWTQDFLDEGINPGKVSQIERRLIDEGDLPRVGGSKHPLEHEIDPK